MSPRKLVLALALLAFAGGVWADNPPPQRDTQPAPAATQDKKESTAKPSSSATSKPVAAPVAAEPRETAPDDAYAPRERRHAGTTPAATDFANKYYPGG